MFDRAGAMGKGQSNVPSDEEQSPTTLPAADESGAASLPVPSATETASKEKPFEPLKVRIKRTPEKDEAGAGTEELVRKNPGLVRGNGEDASLGNRIVAALIDCMVGVGLALGVQVLNILPLVNLGSSISLLACAAYILTRDSLPFLQGQSVGKRAMKIQAVTLDGVSLVGNWQPGMLRNGVLLIPLFPVVEFIVLLTREDTPKPILRLGDEWAKTKVVQAELV